MMVLACSRENNFQYGEFGQNIQKIMEDPDTSYIEPNKPFLPLF